MPSFAIAVTGNSRARQLPGAESPGTSVAIGPGSFSVTETEQTGYAASYSGCSGTIALGESKTCTITNDDKAASLVVIKHVINNEGGSSSAADFTMTVTGNTPSPASFPGAESPDPPVAIGPGSYSVSESGPRATAHRSRATARFSRLGGEECTITNTTSRPAELDRGRDGRSDRCRAGGAPLGSRREHVGGDSSISSLTTTFGNLAGKGSCVVPQIAPARLRLLFALRAGTRVRAPMSSPPGHDDDQRKSPDTTTRRGDHEPSSRS